MGRDLAEEAHDLGEGVGHERQDIVLDDVRDGLTNIVDLGEEGHHARVRRQTEGGSLEFTLEEDIRDALDAGDHGAVDPVKRRLRAVADRRHEAGDGGLHLVDDTHRALDEGGLKVTPSALECLGGGGRFLGGVGHAQVHDGLVELLRRDLTLTHGVTEVTRVRAILQHGLLELTGSARDGVSHLIPVLCRQRASACRLS